MSMKEEQIVTRMLHVDIPGERRRERYNEGGTERGHYNKQGIHGRRKESYTGDPGCRDKPGTKKKKKNTSNDVKKTTARLIYERKGEGKRNRGRPNIYWETDVQDWMEEFDTCANVFHRIPMVKTIYILPTVYTSSHVVRSGPNFAHTRRFISKW